MYEAGCFLRLFFVFPAQGAPERTAFAACGTVLYILSQSLAAAIRHTTSKDYSSVHHREVGVSRSDLRRAQGQTVHTWPLR